MKMIKCKDFNACNRACRDCDVVSNRGCEKEFNFEIPKKFVRIERTDHVSVSWNECPVCRNHVGFRPDVKDYRCVKCGQRIAWN